MPHSLHVSSLLTAIVLLGCGSNEQVLRREGDEARIGRVVSGTAYAWYLRGQWYEDSGKLVEAEYSYEQGSSADSRSGTLYAALGRVRCLLSDRKTDGTFAEGMSRADEKLPVLVEESACALRRGRTGVAIQIARDAVKLAPGSEEASRALVSALRQSRDSQAADSVVRAYRLYSGHALELAARKIAPEHDFPSVADARAQVDAAIRAGDLKQAQNAGVGVIGSGEIALRAALLGKTELAFEQSTQTLTLDPSDFDARVAELVAQSQIALSLTQAGAVRPASVSELGILALGLSIARYDAPVGRMLSSAAPETNAEDPLVRELRRQLARLAPEGPSNLP